MSSSPILLLSSFNEQERRKLTSLVEKLGGRVLQTVGYDQRCTHVVIGTVLSTEKLLAGSIAGKWIVRSEYVEKCYKARKWLPAEMFPLKPGSHSGNAKKLSEVPTRWRDYRVTNGNQGPFKSWTVLLALPEVDRIRYKRLLQAGGAHVISDKPPYVWSLKTSHRLTFVFTDKTLFSSVLSFHLKGIPCLHPDYIKDFIIQQQCPEVVTYKANEYIPPMKTAAPSKCRTILSYMGHTRKSFVMDNAHPPRYLPDKITVLSFKKPHKKSSGPDNCVQPAPAEMKVSILLDKISLRGCQQSYHPHQPDDAVIDLTSDMSQPRAMLHPSTYCVTSQSSTDNVNTLPPNSATVSKCPMSQSSSSCTSLPVIVFMSKSSPSNCVATSLSTVSQPTSDCIVSSNTGCIMSQLPIDSVKPSVSDCVVSELPSDCVAVLSAGYAPSPHSDITVLPTDHVLSELHSDITVLSTDNAISKPHSDISVLSTDNATSEPHLDITVLPTDNATSEPHSDITVLSTHHATSGPHLNITVLSSDHATSEPVSDCVIVQSTDFTTAQPPLECVTAMSSRSDMSTNSDDTAMPLQHKRKRKRKCLLCLDHPQQQQGEFLSSMEQTTVRLDNTTQSLSRTSVSNDTSFTTILLHRQLWTQAPPPAVGKVLASSVECLLEGYLCEQQSGALLIRGLEYSYTLLAHSTPSATILHRLAKILISGKIDYRIVAMVLTKLLLHHPPHGVVRQQYCKLFELFGGNNKWEGLVQGIIDDQPHLLHYMTDILLLDYHMWLIGGHASQPLLHEVIWGRRSHDVVTRALQEFFQHFISLLECYSPDKYSRMESLCYLAYLISHYLQQQSATPPGLSTPPNLQAALLGSSSHARDNLISAINSFHMINDYSNYQQHMIN